MNEQSGDGSIFQSKLLEILLFFLIQYVRPMLYFNASERMAAFGALTFLLLSQQEGIIYISSFQLGVRNNGTCSLFVVCLSN
jgi:hypothetical protein